MSLHVEWRLLGDDAAAVMMVMEGSDEVISPAPIHVDNLASGGASFRCSWPYLPVGRQQKTVFIRDLGDRHMIVREPIPVSVEACDGQVTACCYDLEQFGVGDDEFAALTDLKATLVELYDTLKAAPRLGPLPQQQLEYFGRVLQGA